MGSGASAGGCAIGLAGILPVGKILKGVKIAGEALQSAVKACHSFVGETSVLMADGSTKPISEVRIGDRVKATDPETGETTEREVTATFAHGDEGNALVKLTVTAQDGSQGTVEGTSWHPVWLVEEQTFVNLGDLKPCQHLTAADGSSPIITAVEVHACQENRLRPHRRTVHTYYVLAGQTPMLVNNMGRSSDDDIVTVGRWRSPGEHRAMVDTGMVQRGGGFTYIVQPASRGAYISAWPGSVYVEFDVRRSSLISGGRPGDFKMADSDTMYGRLAAKKGNPVPQLPEAKKIKLGGWGCL